MRVDRLERLIAQLEAGDPIVDGRPYRFDFGIVNDATSEKTTECGTSGCAMGLLPLVFPTEWRYCSFRSVCPIDGDPDTTLLPNHVAEFFGIAYLEARALFWSRSQDGTGLPVLNTDASALQVAANMRLFIQRREEPMPEVPNTPVEQVDHPQHYCSGPDDPYEVIKVLEAWQLTNDALLFNVVKYVARAGKKGDALTDLKKAAWYLNRKISNLEKTNV